MHYYTFLRRILYIHGLPNIKARVVNDKLNHAIHKNTNQYGEPINDFLLAKVAVI